MFIFGAGPTPTGNEVAQQSTMLCCDFDLPIRQNIVHINYSSILCSVSRLTFSLIFCETNDNYYCCYN